MSRVRASIHIARPPRTVYKFAATPCTWALWQAGCVAVSGVLDRPPSVGEQVIAKLSFAGRQARLAWRITVYSKPDRWAMAARVPRYGNAALEFRFTGNGNGTLCECEIAYGGVNPVIDALYLRRRILAEAKTSLARLRQALEPLARAE